MALSSNNSNPKDQKDSKPEDKKGKAEEKKEEKFDPVKVAKNIQTKADKIDKSSVRELLAPSDLNRGGPISKEIDALEEAYLNKLKEVQADPAKIKAEEKNIQDAFANIRQQQKNVVKNICKEGVSKPTNFDLDLQPANAVLKAAAADSVKEKVVEDFSKISGEKAKKVVADNYEPEMKHLNEAIKRRESLVGPMKIAAEHKRLTQHGKMWELIWPVNLEDDKAAEAARDAKKDYENAMYVAKNQDEILAAKREFFERMQQRFNDYFKKRETTWQQKGSPYVIVVDKEGKARVHLSGDEIEKRYSKSKHERADDRGIDIVDPLEKQKEYADMQQHLMDFYAEMRGIRSFVAHLPPLKGNPTTEMLERRAAAVTAILDAAEKGGYKITFPPHIEKELTRLPPKYKWTLTGREVVMSSEQRLQHIRGRIKKLEEGYKVEKERDKKIPELQQETKQLSDKLKQTAAESKISSTLTADIDAEFKKAQSQEVDVKVDAPQPAVDLVLGNQPAVPAVNRDQVAEKMIQASIDKIEKEYVNDVKRVQEVAHEQLGLIGQMIDGSPKGERNAQLFDNQIQDFNNMLKIVRTTSADNQIVALEKEIAKIEDPVKKAELTEKLVKMKDLVAKQKEETLKIEPDLAKMSDKIKNASQEHEQQQRKAKL